MAGLTAAGLEIKRLEDIVADLSAAMVAALGPDTNVEPDGVLGQIIGVFAGELSPVWELAQQQYDSFDPDQAEGTQLDNLGALVGVRRLDATASTGTVVLSGDDGTLVPAGTVFEASANGNRFETVVEGTIANAVLTTGSITFADANPDTITRTAGSWIDDGVTAGSVLVITGSASNNDSFTVASVTASVATLAPSASVTPEGPVGATVTTARLSVAVSGSDTGPLTALQGQVDTIITPVAGLDAVVNPDDVAPGRDAETDLGYRIRREESLQIVGAAVDLAIRANLLQIEGVEQALVVSNRTSADPDANGIPAHAFETVIHPDPGDPDFNLEIAEAIFNLQPAGIRAFGDSTFNVTDTEGFVQQVGFSFATTRRMHTQATITTDANYPANGDAQVAAALLAEGNALSVGDDVLNWKFAAALDSIPGILTVLIEIEEDPADPPTSSANIPVAFNEIATFDSGDIDVIST